MNERSPDVVELLDLPRATRILDIGCGDGYDLRQIAQRAPGADRFWGIDTSARAIRSASRQPHCDARLAFAVVDVSAGLPFESEQFDLIFSNNLLECIPDQSALLHEVHRVLGEHGRVVLAHFDWDTQVIHG
jgi:ubiquinone/menaquinone biosynthesis C-methylase UbiE